MTTLMDRLLGRTGWHRRDAATWAAMEQRLAAMDDQDALIADLAAQRDEWRTLAEAATAQVEEFRERVTVAEAAAAEARRDAEQAAANATRLRADLANATAVRMPVYAADAPTLEQLPITPVVTLQTRGAA